MSPEQMRSSKHVDSRTDIWSLGVVLYEMLVGKVPFLADTLPELCAIVLDKESPPEPPRALRPEIPEELEAAVLRCLAKNREERFTDTAEVAAALAPFAGENGAQIAQRCQRILEAAGLRSAGSSIVVPVGPASVGPRSRALPSSVPTAVTGGGDSAPIASKESTISAAPPSARAVSATTGPTTGVDTATAFGGTDAGTKKPNRVALGALMGAGAALIVAVGGYRLLRGDAPGAPAQAGPAGQQQGAIAAQLPPSAPAPASAAPPAASSAAAPPASASSAPAAPIIEPRPAVSAAPKPAPTARPSAPPRKPSSVFDDRQ
jgi:serine/threonine-protein kinase